MVVQVTGDGGGGRNTEKFVGHGLEIMHAEAHAYKKPHSENLHRNKCVLEETHGSIDVLYIHVV